MALDQRAGDTAIPPDAVDHDLAWYGTMPGDCIRGRRGSPLAHNRESGDLRGGGCRSSTSPTRDAAAGRRAAGVAQRRRRNGADVAVHRRGAGRDGAGGGVSGIRPTRGAKADLLRGSLSDRSRFLTRCLTLLGAQLPRRYRSRHFRGVVSLVAGRHTRNGHFNISPGGGGNGHWCRAVQSCCWLIVVVAGQTRHSCRWCARQLASPVPGRDAGQSLDVRVSRPTPVINTTVLCRRYRQPSLTSPLVGYRPYMVHRRPPYTRK